jgi:hypothetical protein
LKVRYVSGSERIELWDGRVISLGDEIEVDSKIGNELLSRVGWQPAEVSTKKKDAQGAKKVKDVV